MARDGGRGGRASPPARGAAGAGSQLTTAAVTLGNHVNWRRCETPVTFREALERRVLVFDGAMGTQIQGHQLTAAEFGGKEGANDLLTLTRPALIEAIHGRYYAVGCDVVETNTFGSSRLKLDKSGLGNRTYEVNFRAAVAARRVAERHATPDQPRF